MDTLAPPPGEPEDQEPTDEELLQRSVDFHVNALTFSKATEKRAQLALLAKACVGVARIVDDGFDEKKAIEQLTAAAVALGLPKRAASTAWKRVRAKELAIPESVPDDVGTHVLVPGTHYEGMVDGLPKWREQTIHDFTGDMLTNHPRYNPSNKLFVRAGTVGEVFDGCFKPISPARLRIMLVPRAYKWIQNPTTGERARVFVPLTSDLADLVRARAENHPLIDKLRYITRSTVVTPTGAISKPGWNEGGVWDLSNKDLGDPGDPREVFDDLLCDFPWASEAARQNAIGAILTCFLRPYIDGNVPLVLVTSTVERTGKTKFIEEVVGIIILNGPMPAMQLSGTDEERDKRIFAQLSRGAQVVHIDNLRAYLDSSAICSLITARVYAGRRLGESTIIEVPNETVWFASGNNISATGEIAKRACPIPFLPTVANPELRGDFRHPDLAKYVRSVRRRVIATMAAMYSSWRSAGEPGCPIRMGGFGEYTRIVGGTMHHAGFTEWMTNYASFAEKTDPEGMDFIRFVEDWIERGSAESKPSQLRERAVELGLFERKLGRAGSDRAQDTAFAMLLRQYLNRVIATTEGEYKVLETFGANGRLYFPCKV